MSFGIKDLKNFLRQFFRSFMLYLIYKIMWVMCMIKKQETMILSEYTRIYDLVVPKDNMLRKINYLLLKSIFDLSDVDIVDTKRRLL